MTSAVAYFPSISCLASWAWPAIQYLMIILRNWVIRVCEFGVVFPFTLCCPGRVEEWNQQIFTNTNIPISDSAYDSRIVKCFWDQKLTLPPGFSLCPVSWQPIGPVFWCHVFNRKDFESIFTIMWPTMPCMKFDYETWRKHKMLRCYNLLVFSTWHLNKVGDQQKSCAVQSSHYHSAKM